MIRLITRIKAILFLLFNYNSCFILIKVNKKDEAYALAIITPEHLIQAEESLTKLVDQVEEGQIEIIAGEQGAINVEQAKELANGQRY